MASAGRWSLQACGRLLLRTACDVRREPMFMLLLAAVFSFGPIGWTGPATAGAAAFALVLDLAKQAVITRRLRT